jgi:hypothetical protein
MRRTAILGLFLLNLLSTSCGSAANKDAMVQAAVVTAAIVGEAVAESAARDAEKGQARKARAAARPAIRSWRLVRNMDADGEEDSSDSDESDTGNEPASQGDGPDSNDGSIGQCMVTPRNGRRTVCN